MATKVLMLCLGNICRSPLAQGILESMVNSAELTVDSAGTGGFHIGEKPDPRSIAVAQKHGIDISQQRCRKFTVQDFKKFDVIYAMDKSNYENIIAKADNPEDRKKVKLLLNETDMAENEVPDPYYGGRNGFDHVYDLIEQACTAIVGKIKS